MNILEAITEMKNGKIVLNDKTEYCRYMQHWSGPLGNKISIISVRPARLERGERNGEGFLEGMLFSVDEVCSNEWEIYELTDK